MIEYIISFYIIYYLSVLLHEFAHFIAAKCIKLNVDRMKIGEDFFAVTIYKLSISPLCVSGHIEFDLNHLKDKSIMQIIIFYLSGMISNIFLIIISLFFGKYFHMFLISNIYLVFCSVIPISKKSDLYNCIYICKNKKNNNL